MDMTQQSQSGYADVILGAAHGLPSSHEQDGAQGFAEALAQSSGNHIGFGAPNDRFQPSHPEQMQPQGMASLEQGGLADMISSHLPGDMPAMPLGSDLFSDILTPTGRSSLPFSPSQTLALIANVKNADSTRPFDPSAMQQQLQQMPQTNDRRASTTTTSTLPPAPVLAGSSDAANETASDEHGKPAKTRSGAGVGGSAIGSTRRAKFRRSRTGCLVCRKRKVKCDQDGLPCKQCRIGQRECHYEETPSKRKRKSKVSSQEISSEEALGDMSASSFPHRRRQSNTTTSEISRASSFGSGDRKSIMSELSRSSLDVSACGGSTGSMTFAPMGLPFELTAPDASDARRFDERELFAAHTHIDDLSDTEQMRSLGQARRLSDEAVPEQSESSTIRSSIDDDVSLAYTHDSDSRDSLSQWTSASSVFTSLSGHDDWSLGAMKGVPETGALPMAHGHSIPDLGGDAHAMDAGQIDHGALHAARFGDLSGTASDATLTSYNMANGLLPGGQAIDVGGDLSKLSWSPQVMTNHAPPGSDAMHDPNAMAFSQAAYTGPLHF